MEIRNENGRRVLYADEGKILQSVTDGLVIGPWLILGKNDSEIHYHDIDEPTAEGSPRANAARFHVEVEEPSDDATESIEETEPIADSSEPTDDVPVDKAEPVNEESELIE